MASLRDGEETTPPAAPARQQRALTRRETALPEALEETIHWLLDNVEEIASDMVRRSFAQVDGLADRLDELFDDHRIASEASIARQATMMLRGEEAESLTLAAETVDYLRDVARRGVSLDQIIRSTRYGMTYVWERVARHLVETAGAESGALILRWGMHHLVYANRLADGAIQVYGEERERWARSAAALRAATVRELLDGADADADLDVASRRLNYELRRAQLALVAWADPGGDSQAALRLLDAAVADVAAALGSARPLVVADGVAVLWAWVSPADGRDERAIVDGLVPAGVHVAVGRCGHGVEGFRVSHLEAVEARRFALRMRRADPVVRYRRVELPALLTSDPARARGFVAEQLGPLAGDDAASAQLRETLLAYLDAGLSKLEAANRLSVHQHTVANRLRRAEELLGRPLSAGRVLELHAALALRRDLGAPPP